MIQAVGKVVHELMPPAQAFDFYQTMKRRAGTGGGEEVAGGHGTPIRRRPPADGARAQRGPHLRQPHGPWRRCRQAAGRRGPARALRRDGRHATCRC
ncbi:MAG: hypothetical protein MZU84_04770 [Sphingobacterium sp.]|nr:hypothetical protein [Sphingobacterium sp.]